MWLDEAVAVLHTLNSIAAGVGELLRYLPFCGLVGFDVVVVDAFELEDVVAGVEVCVCCVLSLFAGTPETWNGAKRIGGKDIFVKAGLTGMEIRCRVQCRIEG